MKARRAGSSKGRAGKKEVVVRMYDVGFGDSFLIFFPTIDGVRKVLMDCGSIKAGTQPLKAVVQDIVNDVTDNDGVPRIDIVVCTHRHKDHVAGFDSALWSKVEVREVWMPWTEEPDDPQARHIRETQSSLALQLDRNLAGVTAKSHLSLAEARAYRELAINALSNENAMSTLHSGFAGKPDRHFLPEKDKDGKVILTMRTPALPGVTIRVLGPSWEEEVIRDMDPPAGQSYLKLQSATSQQADVLGAFPTEWRVDPDDYPADLRLPENICKGIEATGFQMEPAVAVALEKAVNGTSLMLLFQIGKANLLFPGDAQWGTWNSVLKKADLTDLLSKTNFYKVGHHGSHNATPVDFVEHVLGKDFWAMVSTRNMDNWPRIPKKELLEALGKRTKKLARSDKPAESPKATFDASAGKYVDAHIPV